MKRTERQTTVHKRKTKGLRKREVKHTKRIFKRKNGDTAVIIELNLMIIKSNNDLNKENKMALIQSSIVPCYFRYGWCQQYSLA